MSEWLEFHPYSSFNLIIKFGIDVLSGRLKWDVKTMSFYKKECSYQVIFLDIFFISNTLIH